MLIAKSSNFCQIKNLIEQNFGLIVNEFTSLRNVMFLQTNQGEKILKKKKILLSEHQFILQELTYLKEHNFFNTLSYHRNKVGEGFMLFDQQIYVIMDRIHGEQCSYKNDLHLKTTTKTLANLHLAGTGFHTLLKDRQVVGKLIPRLKKELEELKFIKQLLQTNKPLTLFDDRVYGAIDEQIRAAVEIIDDLSQTRYFDLCKESDKITICHHDLVDHNIIINNGEAFFIDFDDSIVDLKVHDLCNYLNRVEYFFEYDISKYYSLLNNYMTINRLDHREWEILFKMLLFPYDFCCLSKEYYDGRCTGTFQYSEDIYYQKLEHILKNRSQKRELFQQILNEKNYL
ncbi:MAG: CotS family spore coat protein [Oligoflexia bacterium]|nr:CotS family spore coat protein [Oligoflexia bacterium]